MAVMLMFTSSLRAQGHAWQEDVEAELGAGMAVFPWFMGSDEYRVLPIPVIDLSYKKYLFLSTTQGLGLRAMLAPNFIVGARFLYDYGRPQHGHAKDMGSLPGSLDAGVFARYLILPWYINGDVQTAVTTAGHEGTYGSLGAGYIWEINYNWELNTRGSVTLADENYMDAYFGVDAADAAKTGFAQYEPNGSIRDFSGSTVISFFGIKQWRIFSSLGASILFKEAGDSDVVQDQLQWRFMIGATYKF